MKKTLALALIVLCVAPIVLIAQKKPAAKPRRSAPATAAPTPIPTNMVEAATKVADQLKLVSRFLFVYGKVANGLEIAEDQVKRGDTTPALAARNQQIKQSLVSNINGLKAGIDKVALEFKNNDRLQVQYLKLTGGSDAVADAEQFALAGKYD
ncbi:MAG: hypothetical protein ABI882_08795, partial [Acidobacteriota bacterium]